MDESLLIPDDLAGCQTLIGQMAKTITEQSQAIRDRDQTISEQQKKIQEQKLTIDELIRRGYLKRQERYLEDPNQLKLDLGNTDEAANAADGLADAVAEAEEIVIQYKRRKQTKKRRHEQLPDHLERREFLAPIADELKYCLEHGERTLIGYDVVETLEYDPPKLWVRVTKYAKYVCAAAGECGVNSPPRPRSLVEGNRYGTSVAAQILTGKYGYHLPIYRQQDFFAGSGWMPCRSTLLNIQQAAAEVLHPFAVYLAGQVRGSGYLGTDDTRVTLLLPPEIPAAKPGDAKSQRIHEVFTAARAEGNPSVSGRMWVYRSLTIPINVFDFTVSRHRDGPDDFLVATGFTGKMLADCYTGYQKITLRSDARIERGACNAHARRKLFDSRDHYPLLSSQLLSMYQELYDIEDRARTMSDGERLLLRQTAAVPVWRRIEALVDSPAARSVLPKDAFAESLGYLRNHRQELQLYLSDPRLPIDNNETEQLMKQVAIGRKNWLFIGSVAAGERAADILTVVSSALRNDLDVWAYVKSLLDALLSGVTDYEPLRPDRWAASHPEHIRTYRAEERRNRADAKQYRRAQRRSPSPESL